MEKIKKFILGNREPAYSNKLPNQLLLTCRALVGGYLLYLAYGLVEGVANPESEKMQIIFILAIILFVVCGVLFLYDSIRNMVIGRYVGGKLDLGENPDNFLNAKDADDYDDVITEDEAIEEYAAEEAGVEEKEEV